MRTSLPPIAWASHSQGKVIEPNGYVNAIVLERDSASPILSPQPHWLARTFDGGVQIGFTLTKPVRVDQYPDGTEPGAEGIAYLHDVIALLEQTYEATRVTRYMNPEHPEVAVKQNKRVGPRTLQQLTTREQRQRRRGQSTSAAKTEAARETLSGINAGKQDAADERAARYLALVEGGLTQQEIADRDGVSIDAVKSVLKRARAAERAEEQRIEREQREWVVRVGQRNQRSVKYSDHQLLMIQQYPDAVWEHHADGSITIDIGEGDSVTVSA